MLLQCKSKEFLSVDTTDVMFVNVVPVCVCVCGGGGGVLPMMGTWLYGGGSTRKDTILRLKVYERVEISQVEGTFPSKWTSGRSLPIQHFLE